MTRRDAQAVLACLALTIALGLVLLVAFDPGVQTLEAEELVARQDDAREFLIADLFFIAVYAVLSPIAIWRFAARPGLGWPKVAAPLLAAAGAVDLAENVLLLASTGSISEGRVDAAHALAVPKVALFVAGVLLALLVNFRAWRTLRIARGASAERPSWGSDD